jgi:transmembrane 9 superfamily protein 3
MWWCPSFSEPTVKKEYCSVELTDAKYKAFVYAIDNHYWYQMYIGKGFYH